MKKFIIIIIILIFLILSSSFLFLAYGPGGFNQQIEFTVQENFGASSIANELKAKGLIRSKIVFKLLARFSGLENKLIAGTHVFPARASIADILKLLSLKQLSSREVKITIIEGWKIKDIAEYLKNQGFFTEEDFLEAAKINNWKSFYYFLDDPQIKTLEGYLFPDTYIVYRDAKPEDIIKKMLDNFKNKINSEILIDLKNSGRSLHEAIILASIIEKEALYDEDRYMISDIFLKRLKEGIGLQSDATVNYVTGKKTLRPSAKDLKIDSPYNTYKYRGLPPGPICNPGLSSIIASVYPKSNPYFYFLTDNEGRAHFAKTYNEHLINIAKYLDKNNNSL